MSLVRHEKEGQIGLSERQSPMKLTQELSKMNKHYEEVALGKLRQLHADTAEHSQKLEADLAGCTEALVAVTKFFGEEGTSPSNFLATLDRFLNVYHEAVKKITLCPKKYQGVIREQPTLHSNN